jgi:hypothetical protein
MAWIFAWHSSDTALKRYRFADDEGLQFVRRFDSGHPVRPQTIKLVAAGD